MLNLIGGKVRTVAVPFVLLLSATFAECAFAQYPVRPYTYGYQGSYYTPYQPYYQRWQYVAPGYYRGTYGNRLNYGMSPYPNGIIYTAPSGPEISSGLFPQTAPPGTSMPYGWW
jgi:hypothetical protein